MVVGTLAAAACVPKAKSAILLVGFYFAVGADNFVSLIDGTFKIIGRDPVVVKINAHAIVKIYPHLDGIIGVDSIAYQAFFLSYRCEGYGFAAIVIVK